MTPSPSANAFVVFRTDWAAWLLLLILASIAMSVPVAANVPLWLTLGESLMLGLFFCVVLYRFGLLCTVTVGVVHDILLDAPLTLDPSRWYFWRGLVPLAIVLAIAIWGFKNVLGKQSVLPDDALEG